MVAIKIIKKNAFMADHSKQESEVEIMKLIDHPNCVRFIEQYESLNKVYIVMEMMQGGELLDRIVGQDHFSETESARVVLQLLSAVEHIHSRGIVHRDIKPENVLYVSIADNSPVKLADFGLAGRLDHHHGAGGARDHRVGGARAPFTTMCGTPLYCAPEVIASEHYGAACDVWSVGVILYLLLCGCPPFYQGLPVPVLFERIKRGQYGFSDTHWRDVSPEAKDLIRRMLTVDQGRRAEPRECLRHSWLKRYVASELPRHKLTGHARLRNWNALRKVKGAANLVAAMHRWSADQPPPSPASPQSPDGRQAILEEVGRDPQRLAELKEAFQHLDYGKTGAIEASDIKEALQRQGAAPSAEGVARILSRLELREGGKVDEEAFIAQMGPGAVGPGRGSRASADLRAATLRGVFDFFDADRDGTVSAAELRVALRRLGFAVSEGEVAQMFALAGAEGADALSRTQFEELMQQHLDTPDGEARTHEPGSPDSRFLGSDSDVPDAPDDSEEDEGGTGGGTGGGWSGPAFGARLA